MTIQRLGIQTLGTDAMASNVQPTSHVGADFTALLMQLLNTQPEAPAGTTLPAAVANVLKDLEEKPSGEEDPATSELAMVLAALTPATVTMRPEVSGAISSATGSVSTAALTETGMEPATDPEPGMLLQAFVPMNEGDESGMAADLMNAVDTDASEANVTDDVRAHIPFSLDPLRDSRPAMGQENPARHLQSQVGTRPWADELGTQVTWMADRGQQSASIRLTPEHLGPLEVRISIKDDQASVWFGASHADTRAAIENALPRLREMLAGQGLSLNDAGVFRESPKEQQSQSQSGGSQHAEGAASPDGSTTANVSSVSMIDAYA